MVSRNGKSANTANDGSAENSVKVRLVLYKWVWRKHFEVACGIVPFASLWSGVAALV